MRMCSACVLKSGAMNAVQCMNAHVGSFGLHMWVPLTRGMLRSVVMWPKEGGRRRKQLLVRSSRCSCRLHSASGSSCRHSRVRPKQVLPRVRT